MPTSLPVATGSGRVVVLDGTTYVVTPLDQQQWAEYEAWLQDTYIDTTKRNLDGLSDDQQQKLLAQAFQTASMMTIVSEEAQVLSATPAGMFRLFWLGLAKRQPNLTIDEVAAIMDTTEKVEKAMSSFHRANDTSSGNGQSKKKRTKRSPKRQSRRVYS